MHQNPGLDYLECQFGVPGHTKPSPDSYFGVAKSTPSRSEAWGCQGTTEATRGSTKKMAAILGKVSYYDWKSFLGQFFKSKPIPKVKDSRLSCVKREGPKVALYYKKELSDPFTEFKDMSLDGAGPGAMMSPAAPFKGLEQFGVEFTGISDKRKKELDDHFKKYYVANKQSDAYSEMFSQQHNE